MTYDNEYSRSNALFGQDPEPSLVRYADRLIPGGPVLDIGAGQGRNALFLARQGLTVHALEPSTVAGAALGALAAKENLPLSVFTDPFGAFHPPVPSYAGILVFGLIPDLRRGEITDLADRVGRWSSPGALLWVTAFTTGDPAFPKWQATAEEIDPRSFRRPDGRIRTYLEPGGILRLFPGFSPVHHWEGLGPEHRHGDGAPERHGMDEAVFQAESSPKGSAP